MDDVLCTDTDGIARVSRALASPARIRLLVQLAERPLSVGELVAATHLKQANMSKHLGVLHAAKLVHTTRQGNRIIYSVVDPQVVAMLALVRARVTPRT